MGTPTQEELGTWHRFFAVEANNRAWQLVEAETRTPSEDEEMLAVAHAAAWHWSTIGTPHNLYLARMLLGQVCGLLGHAALAMQHSRAAYQYATTHDSPAWELAFAHAVMATAAAAAGDGATHRWHYDEARSRGVALEDAQDREIFEATFRRIPAPAEHP